MSRRVFLSHAGADTAAARALKERMLAVPDTADLQVWFDKDDLEAGRPWQPQLEAAIANSDVFVVLVGSRGIVNWVDGEVQVALGRAMTDKTYPFIPVLAADAPGTETLPAFVRLYQGVSDIERQPEQFAKLMAAILGRSGSGGGPGTQQLEPRPFFGLRAIDESRSHLFFGRESESDDLVGRVAQQPLVLVSGDSGSGKSSLVRAGLVPRFRGGALATRKGERPEDRIWHVVVTRPRSRPWTVLGEAVETAARALGVNLADTRALIEAASSKDPDKVRWALRCGLEAEHTRILLVVDQFEELFTNTPVVEREPFINLLLDLADPRDDRIRVVLTMRHDYVNLCNGIGALQQRLDSDERRARFLLGRMSDDGLERIVTEPLRLAGIDEADRNLLARTVRDEVGQRPGDLALVQMALTETWDARTAHGGNLLAAYAAVGRVEGALAKAAEQVRSNALHTAEHGDLAPLLDPVLVRLVRLGDTGGATRRVASRDEFDDRRWTLVQLLAGEEGKRLILLGGDEQRPTAEISHEALVTAWAHFQTLLHTVSEDKRKLDALIPEAKAWAAAPRGERRKRRAAGADLELFNTLASNRADWLSTDEHAFLRDSNAAVTQSRWAQRGGIAVLVLAVVVVGILWQKAANEANRANQEANRANQEANRANQEANRANQAASRANQEADRANQAVATGLWNLLSFRAQDGKLEPHELNTLWTLRRDIGNIRNPFIAEIHKQDRLLRLGRKPYEISRALGFQWLSAENAQENHKKILRFLENNSSKDEVKYLAQSAEAMSLKFSHSQADDAFTMVLAMLAKAPTYDQFSALAPIIVALATKISDRQGRLGFNILIDILRSSQFRESPLDLGPSIAALTVHFPEDEAEQAQLTLLTLIEYHSSLFALEAIAPAVGELAKKLPIGHPLNVKALYTIFDGLKKIGNPDLLTSVASSANILALKLSDDQAVQCFDKYRSAYANLGIYMPTFLALLRNEKSDQALATLLAMLVANIPIINSVESSIQISKIATTMQTYIRTISHEEAQSFLNNVVETLFSNSAAFDTNAALPVTRIVAKYIKRKEADSQISDSIKLISDMIKKDPWEIEIERPLFIIQTLIQYMTVEQAKEVIFQILSLAKNEKRNISDYAPILAAFKDGITSSQAAEILNIILSLAESGTYSDSARSLPHLQEVANRIVDEIHVEQVLKQVRHSLDHSTEPYAVSNIAGVATLLASKLSDEMIDSAISIIDSALHANSSPDTISAVVPAIRKFRTLSQKNAEIILHILIKLLDTASYSSIDIIAESVVKVASKIEQKEAETAHSSVLAKISKTSAPEELPALASAALALSRMFSNDAARTRLPAMRDTYKSGLAWASTPSEAKIWAEMLLDMLDLMPEQDRFDAIVEALKYPTSVGPATDLLLNGLHKISNAAPGAAAGLDATVEWLRGQRDLPTPVDAPPACPQPLQPLQSSIELACPTPPG